MREESILLKKIVRVGNSAGVILPKGWLYGMAKVILVQKNPEPERELFHILGKDINDVKALALVGSYARGEQTIESDIDVLAITNTLNKRIKHGKYDILFISEESLQKNLRNNIFPLLPMLIEAKPLINKNLIEKDRKVRLTKKNLSFHFETTKSAIKVVQSEIDFIKGLGKENVGDVSAYSLVLRLREIYILDCLLNDRIWNKKEFLKLIEVKGGSLLAYEGYLRVKNNLRQKSSLHAEEAKNLCSFILERLGEQEKRWGKTSK